MSSYRLIQRGAFTMNQLRSNLRTINTHKFATTSSSLTSTTGRTYSTTLTIANNLRSTTTISSPSFTLAIQLNESVIDQEAREKTRLIHLLLIAVAIFVCCPSSLPTLSSSSIINSSSSSSTATGSSSSSSNGGSRTIGGRSGVSSTLCCSDLADGGDEEGI